MDRIDRIRLVENEATIQRSIGTDSNLPRPWRAGAGGRGKMAAEMLFAPDIPSPGGDGLSQVTYG